MRLYEMEKMDHGWKSRKILREMLGEVR
jgi:hypothetical protein